MKKAVELYKYFSDKRFSTIAGTLVYFMLMSIAPFCLWLTLVCGNVDVSGLLSNELFESVSPFLRYLKSSAESAASGAGIVLLVTSLYSSTNFFYHLRRSGEIIYDSKRVKSGLKLRLASLALIFAAIILMTVLTAVIVAGSWILERYLNPIISDLIIYSFITTVAFGVALVLNLFCCPYKQKLSEATPGALLTTALWLASLIGFTVYTQFATPERLYGKIAFLIIFLLWCYVLMNSFVIGVIYNGKYSNARVYKTLM
ncbi:MAG: YihY/virulence factor BrkB family protein [Ruminococcus flavefaciens]|nr:YihY/virulence factor BrkB family protein [Ruminococcus flavefaciens]